MRIIMPSFETLEWMPPTINLLKKLDSLGHEVVFITIYPNKYLNTLKLKNVRNIYLHSKEINLVKKIKYIKGISGILFRLDVAAKKVIARRLNKVLSKELQKGGFLWIVNEMTVLLGGTKFLRNRNYGFLVYELHEKKFYARNIEFAAKHADFVVVPEYCRAHIMQSRYELQKLPIILPNKSDINIDDCVLSENAKSAIEKIKSLQRHSNKVLIYMGGIGLERPLEALLSALREIQFCKLVVLSSESTYLRKLQEKYDDVLIYLGRFNPPEHLAVAQFADVGVLNYVSINPTQGLNALFCAPNKIFEYTGLGLPVIANDIPGLRFPILNSGCGEIVDYQNEKSVSAALKKIFDNYQEYVKEASAFYNSVNVDEILNDILSIIEN